MGKELFARDAKIAVIVVNWNGWRYTLDCLAALRTTQNARWHLIIVDNASSDGSPAHLENLGDDVTLIKSPTNSGWAGGNNLGIRHAIACGYEQLFLLNNDAEVLPDTLHVLQDTFAACAETLPILGPVHMTMDGTNYNFIGADIDYTGLPVVRSGDGLKAEDIESIYETPYIRGAGIFAHRRHFEAIGFFGEDFFLNFDETDWAFRARKQGFRLLVVRDAIIRHVVSGSIGGVGSPLNRYFLVRNRLLFSERHGTFKQRLHTYRALYWQGRDIAGGKTKLSWLKRLLFSGESETVAFRTGIRDYCLRRFGDCPPAIRRLNSAPQDEGDPTAL